MKSTASTIINFGKGHPDPALLPHKLFARASQAVSEHLLCKAAEQPSLNEAADLPNSDHGTLLDYCPSKGQPVYREGLARFINRQSDDGW